MRRLAIFLVLTATVASVPAVAAGSPSAPELPDLSVLACRPGLRTSASDVQDASVEIPDAC
jgi:hypothetical protein